MRTDVDAIRHFQEAVKILDTFGIKMEDLHSDIISVSKYEGPVLILFENFNTTDELLAYARGYAKAKEEKP